MILKNSNKVLLVCNKYLTRKIHQNIVNEHFLKDSPLIHEEVKLAQRLLKVCVIGVPNVGKSSFINYLMDRKVCPASNKVHTTRSQSKAIFTQGNAQIIFLDTPGVVNVKEQKQHNLEDTFVKDSKRSLKEADLISVIHDVSNLWTRERLDIKIVHLLEEFVKIPSVLILNKVDLLKSKRKLLEITRLITQNSLDGKQLSGKGPPKPDGKIRGWPRFQEVFMVSSLTGSGLEQLKDYFDSQAKLGQWTYPVNVWSDQSPETIIVNTVKAKFLDYLPQEIPYGVKPAIELFEVSNSDVITAVVLVTCPSTRVARLIAGEADGRLKQITASIQEDLQSTFQQRVRIKIVLQ